MTLTTIAVLILLGGWVLGRLFVRARLPAVLGMLLCGVLIAAFLGERIPAVLWEIAPFLKSFALIVIMLRAGLGINRETLARTGSTPFLMAFIPALLEGLALTGAFRLAFALPWLSCATAAALLAAVSPAVVVPSMLDLKERGYGARNEVPTILLAGAPLDNVFVITLITLFTGLSAGRSVSVGRELLLFPLSIVTGVAVGAAAGFLLVLYLRKHDGKIAAVEKSILLLSVGFLLIKLGDWTRTAALLAVMAVGVVLLERSERVAHELAGMFAKLWVFAEIVLFVLIGLYVDVGQALQGGLRGLAVIAVGLLFRSLGVLAATGFSRLTRKERLFCVAAYLPKATVQAAMASVPLAYGVAGGEVMLTVAVLSIMVTSPLGLFLVRRLGPRLLEVEFPDEVEPRTA